MGLSNWVLGNSDMVNSITAARLYSLVYSDAQEEGGNGSLTKEEKSVVILISKAGQEKAREAGKQVQFQKSRTEVQQDQVIIA